MGEAVPQSTYDWNDYRSWDDDRRWEIVRGEACAMTPAPSVRHQRVQRELTVQLTASFKDRPCEVFPAPTDVKLSDEDVVQPDISVVCDPEKVKRTHIEGAPTLVIEILSPSTSAFDRTRKLRLYARSGVTEVWLITPYPWLAEVLALKGDCYQIAHVYERDDTLESVVFPELRIALAEVFNYPIDPDERVDMVKESHPPYGKRE